MEKFIGKKVIIRADRAGVFYGELSAIEPLGDKWAAEIKNCRRLWYWDGAASISQLATEGTTSPRECKFTVYVDSMVIAGVIEVLPCTSKAIESIESVKIWKR